MVKLSSRAGQRRSAISCRTIRGRLGSISVVSIARAPTPALAASRIKFRLVVGRRDNRFWGPLARRIPQHPLYLQHTPNLQIRDMAECCTRTQKLNKACSSIFRLAALPGENGPPS